jgi:hypothetical protein
MENHEFWSPARTFQRCFYGGNYIGILWGLSIELARPDGAVTFTRLHKASRWDLHPPLLCALSTAESLSCPKCHAKCIPGRVDRGPHDISGSTIINIEVVQKQVGAGLHSCWEDSVGIC